MNDKDYLKLCNDMTLALGDIRVNIESGHIARACESIEKILGHISELEMAAKMPMIDKIRLMGSK